MTNCIKPPREPLSVAASVAGLISLGIQVTQSLVDFYNAYIQYRPFEAFRSSFSRELSELK